MTHKHHVDRHVSILRAQHGSSAKQTRRWLRVGFLPGIGEEPALHHKRPGETLPDALRRMLRDLPPFTTRADFSAFRARLVAAAAIKLVELPEERVRQAVAVLNGEGMPTTMENVFELAGGDRPRITAALRRLSPQLPGVLERRIMAAALMEAHQLAAFIRSGLVPELAGELADRDLDVDPDAVGADLPRRFDAWTPERFDFQQVVDLGVMRSAVQLPWTADNPAGAIDPAIDFMLRHGETPTVSSMRTLIGGGREQLARHLTRRAREKGDVPLPKRLSRDACDVEDLRDALPAEMRDLFNTALDLRRGGPRDDIKPHAIGRVIANPHAQLQVVAAVATLHGPRTKALKRKAGKAAIAAGNLGPALHGVDIANPAEIAAGFTAIRLTLRSLPDRHDAHRVNRDIDAWRLAIEVFDDYLAQPGLPAALADFLAPFRPAWPSGCSDLFKEVAADLDHFKQVSRGELEDDLKPFLEDAPGFIGGVLDAQAQIEALHDDVTAKVAAAEKDAKATWPLEDALDTVARMPDGTLAAVTYRYRVHTWASIMDRINAVTDAFTRDKRNGSYADCFDQHPGDDRLFENRYVVEPLGCYRDGAEIEYPLGIIRLHRDYGFWRARDLPDGAAYALRSERLVEFGLEPGMLEQTGGEIASFGRGKFLRARKARTLLGTFLLPLVEMHHSALVGALQIAARSADALRIGDLEQWNVGSGLETGYDEDDQPFTVLSSIPKKKATPRKSALTKECDALADKLLDIESRRFFQGGPIPVLPRARYDGRGPEREQMLFCKREAGMEGHVINNNSRLLMSGNAGFKSHWSKYVWARLRRMAGDTLDQRRAGHGHTTERMAAYYDVLTDDEKAQLLRTLRQQAEARAAWRRGERPSPLPDAPAAELGFERRRLLSEIAFLEGEGAPAAARLDAARASLRVVEAKIARAGAAA